MGLEREGRGGGKRTPKYGISKTSVVIVNRSRSLKGRDHPLASPQSFQSRLSSFSISSSNSMISVKSGGFHRGKTSESVPISATDFLPSRDAR